MGRVSLRPKLRIHFIDQILWRRHPRIHDDFMAECHRCCPAGSGPLHWHDCVEHRLWERGRDEGADRGGGKGGELRVCVGFARRL